MVPIHTIACPFLRGARKGAAISATGCDDPAKSRGSPGFSLESSLPRSGSPNHLQHGRKVRGVVSHPGIAARQLASLPAVKRISIPGIACRKQQYELGLMLPAGESAIARVTPANATGAISRLPPIDMADIQHTPIAPGPDAVTPPVPQPDGRPM